MILKVKQNENPYDVIGNYIEKHIPVIDDVIAVISIDGKIRNELLLVEISSTNNFVWQIDWWEGEENVELVDFFFVNDACKKNNNNDLISRQQAIDALNKLGESTYEVDYGIVDCDDAINAIAALPPTEPKRGKWIKISPANIYECSECGKSVMTNDICAYDFCHGCGADMREVTA